jgi:hypothetical protein
VTPELAPLEYRDGGLTTFACLERHFIRMTDPTDTLDTSDFWSPDRAVLKADEPAIGHTRADTTVINSSLVRFDSSILTSDPEKAVDD